ncbi:MAG: hypothetical protein ACRER2_19455 [Methylococcales bacterium]
MLVGVGGLVVSSFDDRPSHLFDGLDKNTLAILLSGAGSGKPVYSTRLSRWNEDEVDFIIDYDIKYRMGGAEDEE